LCNIDINAEEYDYELFSLENHTGWYYIQYGSLYLCSFINFLASVL
jgi:hypothetical protein